jgi:probable rRNA maturation factor
MMKKKLKHQIEIVNVDKSYSLEGKKVNALINWILREEAQNNPWAITLIFTDDATITELNQRYFNKTTSTDVIAFTLTDDETLPEGEIYISVDTAAENAEAYGVTLESELCRLAAHGVLHLIGYDDKTDEQRQIMTDLENKALEYVYSS